MTSGWEYARDVGSMPQNEVCYDLGTMTNHTLACVFPIYDWDADNGSANLGAWIEAAAQHAGR